MWFCSSPHTVHRFSLDSTLEFKLVIWPFAPANWLRWDQGHRNPLSAFHCPSLTHPGCRWGKPRQEAAVERQQADPGKLPCWGQLSQARGPTGDPRPLPSFRILLFLWLLLLVFSVKLVYSPYRCLWPGLHFFQFQALLSGGTIQAGFISRAELYPWVNHSNTFLSLCQRAAAFEPRNLPP